MSGLQGKVGNLKLKWKKIPSGPTGQGEVEVDGKVFVIAWKRDAEGLWLEFPHGVFGFDIHGETDDESGVGLIYHMREREHARVYMGLKYQGLGEALTDAQNAEKKKSARVRAQMPGKIVKIHVQLGNSVTKGQSLLIMEAMKMENEIKAPQTGKIQKLLISEGQAVESGADLLVIE